MKVVFLISLTCISHYTYCYIIVFTSATNLYNILSNTIYSFKMQVQYERNI